MSQPNAYDDKMAQLARQVEQLEAATEQMANVLTLFYKSLIERGMDKEDAFTLTAGYMEHIITSNRTRPGGDE